MSARSQSRVFDAIRKSVLEYLVLLAVWMLFVSMMKRQEFIAGALAALIASVADASIKSAKFARFKPKMQWLPLIFWEAWYALDGSWAIMAAMVKHIAGKKSEAEFVSIRMQAGGDDAESWARRTLMTAYLTIPPNFIVLGIDIKEQRMLVHQVSKTGVPLIAQKLGASKEAIMEAPQARGPRHARRDGVEA
ncbi:MAG TPA: Na+/H+ antiporter subunit E [Terriglobales bacterium]|jgi:multisubunit Na+/H+ antiporter MnhE subunit|nr:Na+/H+ antiporter subunit E [Terriglobales bacterium]